MGKKDEAPLEVRRFLALKEKAALGRTSAQRGIVREKRIVKKLPKKSVEKGGGGGGGVENGGWKEEPRRELHLRAKPRRQALLSPRFCSSLNETGRLSIYCSQEKPL